MLSAARSNDPVAERRAERNAGTVAEVAARYVETHAKRRNKSWQQADTLVRRYVLPRWGKLRFDAITRADVRALVSRIEAPVLANQVLAATSAIFSWAMKQDIVDRNPCVGVDRNPTKARERGILSDEEIAEVLVGNRRHRPGRRYGVESPLADRAETRRSRAHAP